MSSVSVREAEALRALSWTGTCNYLDATKHKRGSSKANRGGLLLQVKTSRSTVLNAFSFFGQGSMRRSEKFGMLPERRRFLLVLIFTDLGSLWYRSIDSSLTVFCPAPVIAVRSLAFNTEELE